MYLEQISHHPPIGCYYLVGRGYKIYGSILPDPKIGLNSIVASSGLPHYA